MCAVTEEQIKKLFSYDIEAEKHAINMMLSGNDQEISSALQNRINLVAKKEAAIQAFYCILTEHERLVIKRHVVDGIDWTCLFCGICAKVGRGECQKHQKPNLLQEPRIQEDGAVR